ncbi:MAG: type II secretion system F family protein [Armatimonadetes bacterium]|nr:type II secretion system F family protein [Armatimonadota bacterium]NIM23518.1 type II secretion system F family protein [Armatimonadota bacterium]NIM67384.1 type II secretion system F family protein [Armatimonadota bacterium]NIM75885.1 type II secretion system F family protein [Armatimonadota bacterium]NIN05570.1 type II secretion system F family protein [Armatimonadota bacterium]
MPVYSYVARDTQGQLVTGSTAGADVTIVRRDLRENGYYVVSLSEQREAESLSARWARFRGVKLGDLVIFSQQLATMVGAGLPIVECLYELIEETENQALRMALVQVTQDILAGSTFSQALSRHPRIFSELFVALVHAGEVGGVLDQTLVSIADNLDKEQELREKVKSAFVYPIVVLVVAAAVVTFMLMFIIPVFERVYAQFRAQLPAATLGLIAVSNFLTRFWWLAIAGIAGLVAGFRAFIRTEKGQRIWDRTKLRLPLFGKLIRKIVVTRFVRTLGALVNAGVPMLAALQTSARVAANTEFTEAITKISNDVTEGSSLSGPLRMSGKFPNLVPRLVQVGEESGNLGEMLNKAAHFFDRDIEHSVRRLTTLMEPVLTIILGVIVGAIVISLYLPIFTLATVIRR